MHLWGKERNVACPGMLAEPVDANRQDARGLARSQCVKTDRRRVVSACDVTENDNLRGEDGPHDFIASHYAGTADTVAEWAANYADESGTAPTGEYAAYVDWSAWARDQPITTARVDGAAIIFWNQ
jgi:hypothetical protein